MVCGGPTEMGYPRFLRIVLPLALLFLFLYLSVTKLHVHLHECLQDGKPCRQIPNDVIEDIRVKPSASLKLDPSDVQLLENVMKNCKQHEFQIGRMVEAFRYCMTEKKDILLEEYLIAWRQLIKFMDALGTVFTFISSETMTKVNILQGYLNGEHGKDYRTVTSMVKYELENEVVNFKELPPNRVPSGCRTLLRLHRALKFLEVFLYNLGMSVGKDKTSQMCADAYHKTLSHHHSWFIRQVAEVAFLALPPIEDMYKVVCVSNHKDAKIVLLTTVDAIVKVYNITQEVYTKHGMLDLP
ncbi:ceramide-1-phosphate transfer protein isoform X2 [Xenopus tropicalis]|uniref:Ceramide-1-phosphate transfer protein n=1 Tax=Xenopus tropicalis TaxID=8364 RepID=A0A8J0R5W1_XENTR|nr:ceramide-1-phosphate transfer protein isoform X2 [Xenopus tropicalis]|eukprot:XP_004919010.1 PREDICTED: glycolipid transfer protein domain-containing protein 2 isoform X2 [Xenopus tropicalis]